MKITDLLNSIDSVMGSVTIPFPMIPPQLIMCGVMARPGVSAIRMTQNIIKDLAAAGFPIEENTDGTPNMTVSFVFNACAKGVVDEFTNNAVVDTPVQIGQATITIRGILS